MRYTFREHWAELERTEKRHITHRELAERIGLSLSMIKKLIDGNPVTVETLTKVATFLRIPTRDLIHPDEPETVDTFDGPEPNLTFDSFKYRMRGATNEANDAAAHQEEEND